MRLAAAAALAIAVALASGSPDGDDRAVLPGAPAGIGGLAGCTAVSRITFQGTEDQPHELEVVYLFPDRARWSLRALDGNATDRTLYYRFGNQAWVIDPGTSTSRAFEGPERLGTLLQMELRRAVLFYPLGFEWRGGDDETSRTALVRETSSSVEGDPARRSPIIGTLMAELDAEGRPVRIEAIQPSGEPLEALAIDAWQTIGDRSWPARMTLSQGSLPVWTETVDRIVTRIHYVDRFFEPADRRTGGRTNLVQGRAIHSLDLAPITYRSCPVDEVVRGSTPIDWDAHIAQAHAWIAEAAAEFGADGPAVDPVPCFELDPDGRPTACLVRLKVARTTPPDGWTTRSDVPGVALVLDRIQDLDGEAVRFLRSAAPPGERAGVAYCRIQSASGPSGVQLYLPLRPPE